MPPVRRIAIVPPGGLPIPPTDGGAVEHLIYGLIAENEKASQPFEFTVFAHPPKHPGQYSTAQKHTHWEWVRPTLPDRILDRLIMRRFLSRKSCRFKVYPFFHRILRKLAVSEYDLIVLHNRPDFTHYLSRRFKTPLAFHLHNEFLSFPLAEMAAGVAASHQVLTVSRFIGDQLGDAFPDQRPKIRPLLNGIDAERFDRLRWPGARESIRARYGIGSNDLVLLYSGRLVSGKGADHLLNACKLLDDLPDIKLLVVGATGYSDDRPDDFVRSLKETAATLGKRVVFTGYVAYEEMPAFYCAADVAVLPFMFEEPFGLVVTEALSMELPVITTRSGGVPEIVTAQCGILLGRDNLEPDLAAAIRRLHRDPSARLAMGRAGRAAVLDAFTQKHFYDRFAQAVTQG